MSPLPDRFTSSISSGFILGDLETALRFRTPYVAVIAHDSAWSIVVDGEPDGRHPASFLGELRFDRVAEAMGARGVYIDDPRNLAPAIEEGLCLNTVTFIHVPTQLGGISKWEARHGEDSRSAADTPRKQR